MVDPKKKSASELHGWKRFLAQHKLWGGLVVSLFSLGIIVMIVLGWGVALPAAVKAMGSGTAGVVGSVVTSIALIALTLLAMGAIIILLDDWMSTAFSSASDEFQAEQRRANEAEDEVLRQLEGKDKAGLLQLQRYSRAHLVAYYTMGLKQTSRSFFNASIAMWLGFLILLAGITFYIAPLKQWGIEPPTGNFSTVILASAAIVEVIAALFLWVYRSTIGQLTYYYRLQMHSHTSILCFRIAESMSDSDGAKRDIIEHMLSASFAPERPTPLGAKGLRGLALSDTMRLPS